MCAQSSNLGSGKSFESEHDPKNKNAVRAMAIIIKICCCSNKIKHTKRKYYVMFLSVIDV